MRLAFANLQMQAQDQAIPLSLSIGVAAAPAHASAPEPLIHRADLALYAAKAQGRNRFFSFEMQLDTVEQLRN